MRAAEGAMGGGRHISGCERLVPEERIPSILEKMWRRAKSHERGNAHSVNIRIDAVDSAAMRHIPPLAIESVIYETVGEAREASCALLEKNGISKVAARKALEAIAALPRSMRGAMVMDALTGERLDGLGERGVRVSHMDCEDEEKFTNFLQNATGQFPANGATPKAMAKLREAIILASKAASAQGYAGELCWSDDPHYQTGYVASGKVYRRITPMKEQGSPIGGRVLFLWPGTPLAETIDYWQRQPVLVSMGFTSRCEEKVRQLQASGLVRSLNDLEFYDACHAVDGAGHRLFVACANDYLGLRFHGDVISAARDALEQTGIGSGGSRMVTGSNAICGAFEREIADFKGSEAALLFPSGYMANVGLISTICEEGDLILSDEKNHASIIDGCRLSRGKTLVYPHRDVECVEKLLRAHRAAATDCFIVTDGVFSMDGTIAPLPELLALAGNFDAQLIIDDAHGLGVLGARGHGTLEHFGMSMGPRIISVGTCSKALGSLGGIVCGSESLASLLRSRCHPILCSTMLPPSAVAAARKSLDLLRKSPEYVQKIKHLSAMAKDIFQKNSIPTIGDSGAIFPIPIGDERRAISLARELYTRGIYLQGIRYPSVPMGGARLRLTVCASYDEREFANLIGEISNTLKAI
jgi:6-carboxyhexanoate--CoA ligase